jgi:putative endonuclease
MWEHENGCGANHTKKYGPVKLVYYEVFDRIDEAFNREKQIQRWSHAKKNALISGFRDRLQETATCKNATSHKNAQYAAS